MLAEDLSNATRRVLFGALLVGVGVQLWWGVRPGARMPAGDFANYYVAARIAASGEDLTPAYTDFLWFQKRVDAAGLVGQLGAFIPHPPAVALAMLPLVWLDALRAKQVWTAVNVALAVACVAALAGLTRIGWTGAALALVGTGVALANDLALGQMYVPLLLSLAAGLLLVERGRPLTGGVVLGLMLPIKPLAAPLLVYFALRREWRPVAGAAISAGAITAASVAVLGWSVHARYVAVVLPNQLAGRLQDPFHPLWQSWQSLAHRMFLAEPTLNPAPAASAAWLAGALPAVAAALGWGAVVVLVRAAPAERRLHYAAIALATLALAPGGATYHLVVLALPVALLVGELRGSARHGALLLGVIGCTVALALPLASWARRFDGGWTTPLAYPRLWLLSLLLVVALVALARRAGRLPSPRTWAAVAIVAVALCAVGAWRAVPRVYDTAAPVAVTAPELSGRDRTVLAQPEMLGLRLAFLGADPTTGRYELFAVDRKIGPAPLGEPSGAALSPDRRRIAFVAERDGNEDIYVRDLASGEEQRLTADPARDREPCWQDATHLVFASDRGRGLGYTTLYRIDVGP